MRKEEDAPNKTRECGGKEGGQNLMAIQPPPPMACEDLFKCEQRTF